MEIVSKKLVCVFAHPDDEAFGPAGTIAKLANEGVEIYLICVTNGASYGKMKLVEIRKNELLNSAKILGIKETCFLDFQDGELNNNTYHKVTEELRNILDKIKPDTLLTFDLNGFTGHIDHVAVAMETSYLFERLSYVKQILYFREKKEVKKLIGKKFFIYFPDGYDKKDIDLVVDVSKYIGYKKKAMMAHKSQRKDALMFLGLMFNTFLHGHLKEEYFRILRK